MTHGVRALPDPVAPFDGTVGNYGITLGPDGIGGYIRGRAVSLTCTELLLTVDNIKVLLWAICSKPMPVPHNAMNFFALQKLSRSKELGHKGSRWAKQQYRRQAPEQRQVRIATL